MFQDHTVLIAQHLTSTIENEEIIERVTEELIQYVDTKENTQNKVDNMPIKVSELQKCPFCKDVT